MTKCKDCDACGFIEEVEFYTEFCVHLCEKCYKKRKEGNCKKQWE